MDEKDAKALVKKLTDVAYEAGFQHNSKMIWNCRENTISLGDEIVRHLTTPSPQPDAGENCFFWGGRGCRNIRLDVAWKNEKYS